MTRLPLHCPAFAFVCVLLVIGCGCSDGAKRFEIAVALDQSLLEQPPTLTVDLVGLGGGDAHLRDESVDAYFQNDSLRADLAATGQKRSFEFEEGRTEAQVLARNDEIWRVWEDNNMSELMIVVNYLPDAAGDSARRLIIPLRGSRWESRDNRLDVTIQRSRLQVRPQPLPE